MKKIILSLFVFLLVLQVNLMAQLNLSTKKPEVFETLEYSILTKMSKHRDKKRYQHTLRIIRKPALQVVKYYPGYVLKGSPKDYRFYQKEVWLYMISKQFKGAVIVFIDAEIDGFVNEGTDREIDGVGIMTRKGFTTLYTRGEETENDRIIFLLNGKAHNLKTSVYKKLFKLAIDNSKRPWEPFNKRQVQLVEQLKDDDNGESQKIDLSKYLDVNPSEKEGAPLDGKVKPEKPIESTNKPEPQIDPEPQPEQKKEEPASDDNFDLGF